jgi:hypothetical protein
MDYARKDQQENERQALSFDKPWRPKADAFDIIHHGI